MIPKQKIYKIFLVLIKNILAFFVGAIFTVLIIIIFAEPILKHSINEDVGLGIIAVAPAVIIIYSVFFGTGGGILGIAIFNLIRIKKRKDNLGV